VKKTETTASGLLLVGILLLGGCHSACFQTAKIRDGTNATFGITKMAGAENPDISDYSIFVKGEVGREARRSRFGYSLALTFIAPARNRYRNTFTASDRDVEMFPNEWAGVFPELKLEVPRYLPVDFALDLRFIGYLPERAAMLVSWDAADFLTPYGSLSYNVAVAPELTLGTEVNVNRRLSVLLEYVTWLADHDYPDDFTGTVLKRPYSFGVALSYNWPRPQRPYDSRKYTSIGPK
jgi:hypothetical protein